MDGRRRSNLSRIVVVVTLGVVLSGCYWAQPGFDSRRSGFNPHEGSINSTNVATLTERWTATGAIRMVTSAGRVHGITGYPGELTTFDAADGSVEWSAPIDPGDVVNPPVLRFGSQLVVPSATAGDATGCLLRHDIDTGSAEPCATLLAPHDATGELSVEAVSDGSWVVVAYSYQAPGGWGSAIAATNLSNPELRWIVELGSNALLSNPIIVDGVVYAAFGGTTAWTLVGWDLDDTCTPDCEPVVEHDLPSGLAGFVSGISADPTGAKVAVVSTEALYVVDRISGDLLWTGAYPVVGSFDHRSIPTWTPTTLLAPVATRVTDPYLGQTHATAVVAYLVDGCGSATCPATWWAQLDGRPAGQAAAAGDLVYVTSERDFAALPTSCTGTCEPLHHQEGDAVTWFGPPIVANGLVLHSDRGGLRALSLP
jgi:hypothetical protein